MTAEPPPSPWRPEFLAALRLLATISEALAARGLPRPILVGGGAVEFYTGSAVMTGDIDLCSPAQADLEIEMQRHGFIKPKGPGKLTRGWIHPDLALGFEVVASSPLDGQVDATRIRLVEIDQAGERFRVLPVEDMIADRMGQFAAESGGRADMLDQAVKLFSLYPDLDKDYLERRTRYETAGDHGIADIKD